ncbi:Hypothetical protein POVR1_LOCUS99 [uncultured virus]|nr:Hypothetical protein POVR1_LOCUS99 [uncultured virus]
MASNNLLSNEYSDHTVLKLKTDSLSITQLNVAQLGRFQLFPNERVTEGFNWSSTLRTVTILKQLAEKKPELTVLGFRLLAIANDPEKSVAEKNASIKSEAVKLLVEINDLGFSVKSFRMNPSKLFNKGVSPNLLWATPDNYIQSPDFVLEDTESFHQRMKAGFDVMLSDGADIVAAQEMEFGTADGINFTEVHDGLLQTYELYDVVTPDEKRLATTTATYFRKDIFKNVTADHLEAEKDLKTELKCFGESDLKTHVVFLEHLASKKVVAVVNIHADYSKANTEVPWKTLRGLFNKHQNLIVSADFNLTLANEQFFRGPFEDFKGQYTILPTPEPVGIGNPTFDLILCQA